MIKGGGLEKGGARETNLLSMTLWGLMHLSLVVQRCTEFT